MTFWLVAVGLVTLLGQVVLLREILVASFGSELIYLLAMGLQMFGTALGAVAGRRAARMTEARVRVLFVAFAATVPILVGVVRALRVIFRGTPGAYLPFLQQLAGISLVLLPLGILGGLLFTSAARLYVDRSRTLASAYAVESVGGLIGGAASTILIALGVQNLAAALLCGIIAAAAALFGSLGVAPLRDARPSWLRPVASALVLLLVIALWGSKRIDRDLTALNHPQLLDSRDTPYGRATVTGSLGQIVVFENDALAFESQGTSAEEFVHLAAVQVESPRSVLVLGGAVEGLVAEVWKHGPSRVQDVEVDKRLVDLARSFIPATIQMPLEAPGVLTFEEPRRFLERPDRYDLILSGMPEPESGQASRFYTGEFFEICARRLSLGGVMAFRLRSSENLWTPALARRTASIVSAARSAFPDVMVLPGAVNVVVASNRRLVRDPDVLSRRFRERHIEARLVSPAYLRYVYTNDRGAEIESILARTPASESSDARPVCYQYTLVLWLSRFFPALALTDLTQFAPSGHRSAWIAVAALLMAALLACRRSQVLRRTLLVAFAGFAGVLLEGSLILAYQISEGVLYQDLGILLTMFMTGLAIGSWAIGRRADPTPGAERLPAATGVALLLGTAAVACLTAWRVSSPGHGLSSCALFLLAAGLVTGAIFAFASLRRVDDQTVVVAPLYAADLLGGVAGSIAGSLFLIPLAGLPASVLLVGLLAILALLLV